MTASTVARSHVKRGSLLVPVAQILPTLVYFAAFYIGPLLVLLYFRFLTFRTFLFIEPLTLNNYVDVANSETFRILFVRTIFLSFLSAAIAVAIAYPFAYLISFVFPGRSRTLYFLVLVSLFGGYLVRIYAWRAILGMEGMINGTLLTLGWMGAPL